MIGLFLLLAFLFNAAVSGWNVYTLANHIGNPAVSAVCLAISVGCCLWLMVAMAKL